MPKSHVSEHLSAVNVLTDNNHCCNLQDTTFILFSNESRTTDDKILRRNRYNFIPQIQMRLSKKPKAFLECFFAFLQSTSNFQYFLKKEESHSSCISGILDSHRGGYLNVQNVPFQTSFWQSTC